jgi:hypothetical protein
LDRVWSRAASGKAVRTRKKSGATDEIRNAVENLKDGAHVPPERPQAKAT